MVGQVGVRMGVQVGSDAAGDVGSIGVKGFDGRMLGSGRFIDNEMETLASTGFGVTGVGSIGGMVFGVMMVGGRRIGEGSIAVTEDPAEIVVGSVGKTVDSGKVTAGSLGVMVGSDGAKVDATDDVDSIRLTETVSAGPVLVQSKHSKS